MALTLIEPNEHDLRARIAVFGVGGAGGNAVNNMIEKNLEGVEFVTANTDAQALGHSRSSRKLQLGTGVTRGLGAGSKPDVGMTAAEESIEEIATHLEGAHMCFITAGMGGGTGTGAAPVVARIARELGILTVGVVTKPFQFEGTRRMQIAEAGVEAMQQYVDTLIVIPNQNLFQVASERTTFVEAFQMADDVLYQGVQGVTDLMVRPGMINLDFADVRSVMEEMGKAMMGTGEAEGETRAIDAAEKAIANPLLDEVSLKGARGVLINITGGYDLTLFEMDEAANRIKEEVDVNALIKFGSAIDPEMEGRMRVSVVATGIDAEMQAARPPVEAPPRRRPAMTDASGISAVRGMTRRPETPAAAPSAAPVRAAAPVHRNPVQAEPDFADRGDDVAVGEAPAEPARPVERSVATAPSPDDIRARAEEVRQRALAARTRREREDEVSVAEDEPALFDLDEPAPLAAPARPQVSAEARRPASQDPLAAPASSSGGAAAAARSGLFTINKLIHRVAGTGAGAEPGQARAERGYEDAPRDDEAEGEIPAFLRRQAN